MDPLEYFRVRMLDDKDLGYVARSWKTTLYEHGKRPNGAQWSSRPKSMFFNLVNAPIDILLANKITEVVLDPIDRTYIVAWCCYDSEAIHYVFVRDSVRGSGVARALLQRAGIDKRAPLLVTHSTKDGEHIIKKHSARYVPELVYRSHDANLESSANQGRLANVAGHVKTV